ncbi:sulfotransferase [Rhodanobacter sp. DHG33]|uniref:glycosyltransferase family protein n=1 Tax=Rhodanobacter sp. DHG33 TaxID=2775921 RepID=UPI00177D3DAA|nr:sulfotransferase [Rhodanobacter sp. DHG33]MBD8897664.1 sulfotransferase [Rhodanobacter sp. DHG33]
MTQGRRDGGQALLVVGMHRSGTSALTRVLNLHGVALGGDLLDAAADNQAGFWENRRIVDFHERLLAVLDSSWDDPRELRGDWLEMAIAGGFLDELVALLEVEFGASGLWAVKDPRLCRLLPLWLRALASLRIEPKLIFALRDPGEVVGSLMRRNGLSAATGSLLWLRHLAEPVHAAHGLRRCAIDYDELLGNWKSCMDRIAANLGVAWPKLSSECAAEVGAHLQNDLQHQHATVARDLLPVAWRNMLLEVHGEARTLVCDAHDWGGLETTLQEALARFAFAEPIIADLQPASLTERVMGQLVETERAKMAYQAEVERLQGEGETAQHRLTEAEARWQGAEQRLADAARQQDELRQSMKMALEASSLLVDYKNREIEQLGARIQSVEEQRQVANARTGDLESHIGQLNALIAERDEQIRQMLSSHSWRSTALLRMTSTSARRAARGMRRAASSAWRVLSDGQARSRYWVLAKQLGPWGALRQMLRFMRRGGPSPTPGGGLLACVFNLRIAGDVPVVILSTLHCRFVAEAIAHALERVGIASSIIHERPVGGYANVPHFVICPQMFDSMPGLYVSFQMEQSVSSRWFTKEYVNRLENSYAVFDYSIENIAKLVSMGLYSKQFYYLPISYLPDYGRELPLVDECYDVLFYGDINNERRRACIHELEKVCKVKVVSNLFGQDMLNELRKAKVIVNIHYYPGALLESTRLWECLSLGRLVVSEGASDMPRHEELLPLVDFVDEGDFVGMANRVRYWLEHEDLRQEKLAGNAARMALMFNRFDYFFYRFLLATDNIGFEDFWQLVGSAYPLECERLCLNLPEYVDRSASFDRDNRYGFQRFPGLRHEKGWLGAAMSYKYILRLARQCGAPSMVICEDDVEFPEGFERIWAQVWEILSKDPLRWDVFSGVLADLHEDTRVIAAERVGERELILIDRLISMVFNVYNASCYDLIDGWDERNRDVTTNTIDRYLERHSRLRVMTTSPFMVGHKEDLHSTLWGGQNTIYSALISKSEALMREKVDAWYAKHNRWRKRQAK